jgi:hypothetical protein
MKLFPDALPDGLWLVKWIDRFHLGHDAESPKVDVLLQRLPFNALKDIQRLDAWDVGEILGKKVGDESFGPEMRCVPLLAAYIPMVHVGAVVQGARIVANLPGESKRVVLTRATPWNAEARLNSDHTSPSGWSAKIPYKVLNKFEFQFGGYPNFLDSRCVVFEYQDEEYILPKLVIFRAFYAWSSRLINAICGGPWPEAVKKLVSFSEYESGIKTEIDEESGAWKVVLQVGMARHRGPLLALLLFDDFGRSKASAIYSDALQQNQGRRGGDGNRWFINSDIPHRFDPCAFEMDIQAYKLRPLRPSMRNDERARYLITSIVGSSWSLPDQKIEVELHLSGAKGDEQRDAGDDRNGPRIRPPVDGDPDAIGVSASDPNAGDSLNLFNAQPFEYINKPNWKPQRKASSVRLTPAPSASPSDASSLVSGGVPTYAEVSPSPAEVQSKIRARSQQFEFLIRAMEEIQADRAIDSYSVYSPFADAGLTVMRNGLACWSLLSRKDRSAGKVPREGWEVVFDEWVHQGGAKNRERHARCILMLAVRRGQKEVILMEIEPRLAGPTFPMFAVIPNEGVSLWDVIPVLKAIRESNGVFNSRDELFDAFCSMTSVGVDTSKHSYTKKLDAEGNVVAYTGLRVDILANWLQAVLDGSDEQG